MLGYKCRAKRRNEMPTFANAGRVENSSERLPYDVLCILGGSLFLALMAQFSIPLWFTPVPITLQTLGVMLLGALLGSKRGALAVLMYLGEGALGFPVFAGGSGGLAILAGPRGGYLFGFVISAFIIGFLLEKGWKKSHRLTLAALAIGTAVTFGLGALWLSFFVGGKNALVMGVYPFLIGCTLKIFIAKVLIPRTI
jgi:biotin transport system substrate-specific component